MAFPSVRRSLAYVVPCALATASACRDGSTSPRNLTSVGSIVIVPSSATLEVAAQQPLYVTVRDQQGNVLEGRAVQWQSSMTSVATVTVASNPSNATVAAIAPGVATISATSEGKVATATISVTSTPTTDFAIVYAQWTQGVQNADGTIPMILEGNDAVLNVALVNTAFSRAPGQLVLNLTDASGATVRTDTIVPPAFTGLALYDLPIAQFKVPAAALRPGLRWRVRRDPRGVAPDADPTNDAYPRTTPEVMATTALPTMRIRFVPIVLSAHANSTGNVSPGNLESYLPTLRRTFPLGPHLLSVGTPLVSAANFGTAPSGGNEAFWLQVLQDLDVARVADTSSHDTYWVGVVRPPNGFNFTSFGGFAYVPASPTSVARGTHSATVVNTGWFTNTGQSADLVAHELAHNLGRRHSPCGGASGVDPFFPNFSGQIGTPGHDVYSWSIGLATSAAPRAATTGDLMGYCFPQWASPYTYSGVLAARIASAPLPVYQSIRTASRRQHVVVVRGRISHAGVTLLPTMAIAGFPTDGATGAYQVELLDVSGTVLASHRVDGVGVDHSGDSTLTAAIALDESVAGRLSAIRLSGPRATITKGRPTSTTFVNPSTTRVPPATITVRASGGVTAECQGADTAAIAVQDRLTGAVLASASGQRVTFDAPSRATFDISCSDGVRSLRHTPSQANPSVR